MPKSLVALTLATINPPHAISKGDAIKSVTRIVHAWLLKMVALLAPSPSQLTVSSVKVVPSLYLIVTV